MYYINKTFLYSKKNIAGFEILDKDDSDFRILLHYDEAIEFIKNQGGKIYNAEIYEKEIDNFGKVIYDIKADGEKLKDLKDRKLIFNLAIIFNERERYYEEYKELFFISIDDAFVKLIAKILVGGMPSFITILTIL